MLVVTIFEQIINNHKKIIMAKENSISSDTVLKGLALLGGGYLFVELLKMFGNKKTYYTCTKCKYDKLEYGQNVCPNCHSNLKW